MAISHRILKIYCCCAIFSTHYLLLNNNKNYELKFKVIWNTRDRINNNDIYYCYLSEHSSTIFDFNAKIFIFFLPTDHISLITLDNMWFLFINQTNNYLAITALIVQWIWLMLIVKFHKIVIKYSRNNWDVLLNCLIERREEEEIIGNARACNREKEIKIIFLLTYWIIK